MSTKFWSPREYLSMLLWIRKPANQIVRQIILCLLRITDVNRLNNFHIPVNLYDAGNAHY